MYQSKIIRNKDRTKRHSEIFTPPELVNEMLDHVDPSFWLDPAKTVLEPSFGNGAFLVEILQRFMDGLEDIIPDMFERHRHIIENQIFGIELQQDNVTEAIERLGCAHLNHNLVCEDALKYDMSFKKTPPVFEWPK